MKTEVQPIFRIALVAYLLLASFYVLKVLVIGPGTLPDPAIAYLTWWTQQPLVGGARALLWLVNVSLVGSFVGALGMLAFASWARPLFAICIVLVSGSNFLVDIPILQTPLDNAISTLLSVFAGAIIVFAYWSRTSDEFVKKGNLTPQSSGTPR